jgi:hypothetical protein
MTDETDAKRKPHLGTQTNNSGERAVTSDDSTERDRTRAVDHSDLETAYRGRFVGRPSRAIIDALVTLEEAVATSLPVIYSVVDLDALDDLYRNPEEMRFPAELSFCLDQYRFFLSSDGLIEVYEMPLAEDANGDADGDTDAASP